MTRAKNSWLHLAFRSADIFSQSGDLLANRNCPTLKPACRITWWRNAYFSLLEKQKRLEVTNETPNKF